MQGGIGKMPITTLSQGGTAMDRTSKLLLGIIAILLAFNLFKSTPAIGFNGTNQISATSKEHCWVLKGNKLYHVYRTGKGQRLYGNDELVISSSMTLE